MLERSGTVADQFISFFELSNTIPELKRRLFISLLLLGILVLVTDTLLASALNYNLARIIANVLMILFLTAMCWLLWRRRERQELIVLAIFSGSAFFLLLFMFL